MNREYTTQIRNKVTQICVEHDLPAPITVPSAGKLIAEYDGVDSAIKLFEGAYKENKENPDKDNPYAFAAYHATLKVTLLPMREKK